jgi:hypothetical protein
LLALPATAVQRLIAWIKSELPISAMERRKKTCIF